MLWVPLLTYSPICAPFSVAPCRWSWWNTSVNSCSASRKCQRQRGPRPWTPTHTCETGYAPSTCDRSSSRYVVSPLLCLLWVTAFVFHWCGFSVCTQAPLTSTHLILDLWPFSNVILKNCTYSCDHLMFFSLSFLKMQFPGINSLAH